MEFSRLEPGQQAVDELARFVAKLNCQETQQVGYLGADPSQIATFLTERSLLPHQSWIVAREEGQLAGAFGFEADAEIKRAWLFGPFVCHGGWPLVADGLWAQVLALLPSDIPEYELFFNTQNADGLAFARRHGFLFHSDALSLCFAREKLDFLPDDNAPEIAATQHEAFKALHDQIFPGTYYSGRQILQRISANHQVFVVPETNGLSGYAYAEVLPEFEEGNIEFIGVSEPARGRGVGTRLVATALRWMFSFPSLQESFLTTNTSNSAAIALYRKVGFRHLHAMRAFRKKL